MTAEETYQYYIIHRILQLSCTRRIASFLTIGQALSANSINGIPHGVVSRPITSQHLTRESLIPIIVCNPGGDRILAY